VLFHNEILGAILCALVPLTLLVIWAAKCDAWVKLVRHTTPWQRFAAVIAFGVVVGYGGDKEQPLSTRTLQLLTVLRDGTLKDLSGTVASGVQARALEVFSSETWRIAAATTNAIAQARAACDALTNRLATADYKAAYISLDFPRGTPTYTNHNIQVTFEKVVQTPTNLTAWVCFSEAPATNVQVYATYSVAADVWTDLEPTTNYWPATETVNGVPCVRYVYALPDLDGTPLVPQYEVEFGGPSEDQFLSVPEVGVTVQVGETEYLPFTGVDTYPLTNGVLRVYYKGGIAHAAKATYYITQ
jgi:hypothetical protein